MSSSNISIPCQPSLLAQDSKSISLEQWELRSNLIQPSREVINQLVMNFLVVEGYKDGALKFEKESGIKADMDDELIESRIEVRRLIEEGHLEQAIKRLNDINPEILDSNAELYFEMKRQQLVELIKLNKVEEAIVFAQCNLSSHCTRGGPNDARSVTFQAEVDKTMTLLMYEDLAKAPMHELADFSSRQRLASQVNQAILKAQGYSSDLKLAFYWQLLQFSQNQLTAQNFDFPMMSVPGENVKMEGDNSKKVSFQI